MERRYDNETMDRYIRYEAEIVSLLEDVRNMVKSAREEAGIPPGPMRWED